MIRATFVVVWGTVLTMAFASWAYLAARLGRGDPCACDRITRRWARLVLRIAGVRVRLEGADRVDWSQPLVVVGNHQSWFDVWAVVAYLPGRIRFVAKQELGRIPIFGPAWKACGHVSLDRSDRASALRSLDEAAERVREDRLTLVLFPEGTRSPDGRLGPFKKGAFVLAIGTGLTIVPVGIAGSRDVMPKGSWRVSPGEIRIRVGGPIATAGLSHEDRDGLLARSRAAVWDLMEHPDGVVGRPGDSSTGPSAGATTTMEGEDE